MPRFVHRERKHKRIARLKQQGDSANGTVISKKQKRLEQYLKTKLKKDENNTLIEKLAAQDINLDPSLLRSSRKLGRVRETQREVLQRGIKERHAGLNDGQDLLFQARQRLVNSEDDTEDDTEDEYEHHSEDGHIASRLNSVPPFGIGLKRPLESDDTGRPVISKRQRLKRSTANPQQLNLPGDAACGDQNSTSSESEWAGFDDDDRASLPTQDDSETDSSGPDGEAEDIKPRISAFKQWADAQRNAAMGFTPSTGSIAETNVNLKSNFRPRSLTPELLQLDIMKTPAPVRPIEAMTIARPDEVQTARLELPVVQEEQKIVETIHNNPVVVICGDTGSGKTTQVPQMLLENGYGSRVGAGAGDDSSSPSSLQSRGMIGVTQPRRVAATSVAQRVAHELGPEHRHRVAHQVRYDTNLSRTTAIKFMTDGILLREINQDFLLKKYSCIIVDEAHERSVNTDILIGLLTRITALRNQLAKEQADVHCPLKLVIMSATLRVADFLQNSRLFRSGPPPIVEAEGRQHSVTVHFSRRTRKDFIDETVEKVAKGHRKLPPGSILVFLTGQQEIHTFMKGLRERLEISISSPWQNDEPNDYSTIDNDRSLEEDLMSDHDSDVELNLGDDDEFSVAPDAGHFHDRESRVPLKAQIIPLYASLSTSEQMRVFQPPKENHRCIIVATNVAETSLTIPGIRYVFDCGRSKEKQYDHRTGVQQFETVWISKASAEQRKGRAGRTGPGHCWRLYSSAVYDRFFPDHSEPEILRTPLESTVLQLKSLSVANVANFPFPTAPDREQLVKAEGLLKTLGAIEERGNCITALGSQIMQFPLNPRYGKILALAQIHGSVEIAVALVAGLAAGEVFVTEAQAKSVDEDFEESDIAKKHHQKYTRVQAVLARLDDNSDAVKLLTTVVMHAESSSKGRGNSFCADYFLRQKGMEEAQQLRKQLWSISNSSQAGMKAFEAVLPKPKEEDLKKLRQILACGFIDQVAIRADLLQDKGGQGFGRKPRGTIEVAYRTLLPVLSESEIDRSLPLSEQEMMRSVFVHPSSVLAKLSVQEMPAYVIYSHLSRAAPSVVGSSKVKRTRMHPLTPITPNVLAYCAKDTPLIDYGKPLGRCEGSGATRECWVPVSLRSLHGGAVEWPLDVWKVVQRRNARGAWDVERVVAFKRAKLVSSQPRQS